MMKLIHINYYIISFLKTLVSILYLMYLIILAFNIKMIKSICIKYSLTSAHSSKYYKIMFNVLFNVHRSKLKIN